MQSDLGLTLADLHAGLYSFDWRYDRLEEEGAVGLSFEEARQVALEVCANDLGPDEWRDHGGVDIKRVLESLESGAATRWLQAEALVVRVVDGAMFWRSWGDAGVTEPVPEPTAAVGAAFILVAPDYLVETAGADELVELVYGHLPVMSGPVECALLCLRRKDHYGNVRLWDSALQLIRRLQALEALGFWTRTGSHGSGDFAADFMAFLDQRLGQLDRESSPAQATSDPLEES
jgi:hypothetical protein